jgi:hypothetical protein
MEKFNPDNSYKDDDDTGRMSAYGQGKLAGMSSIIANNPVTNPYQFDDVKYAEWTKGYYEGLKMAVGIF